MARRRDRPERIGGKLNSGGEVRRLARSGEWTGPTCGLAPDLLQANLVVLPQDWAFEFLLFCQRNPKPCPVLEVTDPGDPEPRHLAPGADLRTDLPRYRVYQHGELAAEPTEIVRWWRDDLVAFLLGCSFSFEQAMLRAGLPVRHIEQQRNVPMYRTNIACRPAGRIHGPLVVSMRPLRPDQLVRAIEITSRYPEAHGSPVHFGDPAAIGIADLSCPDYGEAVTVRDGELPVFWACGVTPQAAIVEAKPPLAITHSPGCMFVTDWPIESYKRT
jgi:uncharacterized protein YcsI (UPF0317 family)